MINSKFSPRQRQLRSHRRSAAKPFEGLPTSSKCHQPLRPRHHDRRPDARPAGHLCALARGHLEYIVFFLRRSVRNTPSCKSALFRLLPMFTPSPFVFRASPEKLRDYSEHQAATCARRDSIGPREKIVVLCVLTTCPPLRRPLPGRVLWPEYDSDALNASPPRVVQASPLLTAPPAPQITVSGCIFPPLPKPTTRPKCEAAAHRMSFLPLFAGHAQQPDPALAVGLADDRRAPVRQGRGCHR